MHVRRLLPLSGIAFVVIVLVGTVGLGGDSPESDATVAEVVAFYRDNSTRLFFSAFVVAVSIPFLIAFAATLGSRRGSLAQDGAPWRYVLLSGAALLGAILLIVSAIVFACADGADNGSSGEALQGLNLLAADSWVAFNAALGVMMLGAAGCVLTEALVPRWLGWTAFVLGVLLFIPFADFIALILALIWISIVSVILFRRAGVGPAPAPQR